MAKLASTKPNVTVNAVAIEDELTSFNLDIEQETAKTDGLSSVGPERVVGNYDYSLGLEGNFDGAAAQGDATLFALIGSTGVAVGVDPTGNAAGANDPNYDATSMVLSRYGIRAAIGQPVTYSGELQGNSALARTVA